MEDVTKLLEDYLNEVLGVKVNAVPWREVTKLPFFLVDYYLFYEILFYEKLCVIMVAKEGVEVTPSLVRKHREQVQKRWDGICIYVQRIISSYNRKRLIEHRVPFIMPGNQMYLPDLGMDFRERFRRQQVVNKTFTPATQAVVIFALLNEGKKFIPSQLAKALGYTLMSMSRAFDELEVAGVGEVFRHGKERWWVFDDSKRKLWDKAKIMMRSPVKTKVWMQNKKTMIVAGSSALAYFTILNPPSLPIYAISQSEWKKLSESGIQAIPSSEGASLELEIWNYDPALFAKDKIIDPFSLYLSQAQIEDERVQLALEELEEKIKW
jgi:hypothetical protein